MENASKALLIAAGVIIAGLMLMLIMFVFRNFAEYSTARNKIEETDNLAKFNSQFENYDRDGVLGYELISLTNMIIDYNEKHSNLDEVVNNEKYTPVTIRIDFGNHNEMVLKFTRDNILKLFNYGTIYQENPITNNSTLRRVLETAENIERTFGGKDKATLLTKNIDNLIYDKYRESLNSNSIYAMYDDDTKDSIAEQKVLETYNSITGENFSNLSDVQAKIGPDGKNLYTYYEFYQFKKAHFNCTNVHYNDVSGRVDRMEFVFTGVID